MSIRHEACCERRKHHLPRDGERLRRDLLKESFDRRIDVQLSLGCAEKRIRARLHALAAMRDRARVALEDVQLVLDVRAGCGRLAGRRRLAAENAHAVVQRIEHGDIHVVADDCAGVFDAVVLRCALQRMRIEDFDDAIVRDDDASWRERDALRERRSR